MNGPHQADLLRTFLSDSDVPCPGCGYNLRGLQAGACPECNLVLRVALAEPRPGPLIATIVGLAGGAGAAVGLLGLIALEGAVFGVALTDHIPYLLVPIAGMLGEGIPLVLLARPRGLAWFRRRKAAQNWRLAGAAWMATGVSVAVSVGIMTWF